MAVLFYPSEITYFPTKEHLLVVPDCFEGDNRADLFTAAGLNQQTITGEWDFISYGNIDWSPDGAWIVYQRVNSCCREAPPEAPPAGLIRYNVRTGEKTLLFATAKPPNWGFPTSPKWSPDGRWIAFLFQERNIGISVYLIDPHRFSLQLLDKFDQNGGFATLYWETDASTEMMRLYFGETDRPPIQIYLVSTIAGTPPPGTAVSLTPIPARPLYQVVHVVIKDTLNVRIEPGVENPIVGHIPPHGKNIQVVGVGVEVGDDLWVPVIYEAISGWVNSYFLIEQPIP